MGFQDGGVGALGCVGGKDSLGSRVSKLYTCAAGSRSPVTRVDEVQE